MTLLLLSFFFSLDCVHVDTQSNVLDICKSGVPVHVFEVTSVLWCGLIS